MQELRVERPLELPVAMSGQQSSKRMMVVDDEPFNI